MVDNGIEFLGEVGDDGKEAFLGGAAALLFPIDWPEPFGLVMIEAMACGTPVIARRRGSVPEIIDDGVTGFIVETEEEAVAAVARLPQIDRRTVRKIFEERFSADRMAKDYAQLYAMLLQGKRAHLRVDGSVSKWAEPGGGLALRGETL